MRNNYGEKVVVSGLDFEIKTPPGVEAPMKLWIEEKNLTVRELFSEYRQLGLPLDVSTYNQISHLKPKKVCDSQSKNSDHHVMLFEFEGGEVIGIQTHANVLGIRFQKEMMGYLNTQQIQKYNELLNVANRCFWKMDRTLGDVIKYATDGVPASRSCYLAINRQVSNFTVYNRPGQNDVLGVHFKGINKEVLFKLNKTEMANEQRRTFIDDRSKDNILMRTLKSNAR